MLHLRGKRGLIMGVANERSIAWGIAKAMSDAGAGLAFTYQGDAFRKRLEPLAQSVGSNLMMDVDVTDDASLDKAFQTLASSWGSLDFVVHAIAYSEKNELTGRFLDTTRDNFKNSIGSNRVTPFYNVMGVAKAALEATTRYLANDLGADGIRVNAISPGPMKTLAGAAIGGARKTFKHTEMNSPLRSNASLEAVGGTAVYLASDAGAYTTGEVIYVDGGYHVLGMPQSENI